MIGDPAIATLHEDNWTAEGKDYSEAQFQRKFLREGPIPVHLIRRLILPEPGTVAVFDRLVKSLPAR